MLCGRPLASIVSLPYQGVGRVYTFCKMIMLNLQSKEVFLSVLMVLLVFNGYTKVNAACLGATSCSCEVNANGVVVNCRGQKLENVPAFKTENHDIFYYELTLDSNNIQSIEANAFSGIRVKRIVLTNNPISSIAVDAFGGLETDLVDLSLKIDSSMSFPTESLSNLRSLEVLEIVGYGHESLPVGAFSSLSMLKSLSMTHGSLRSLSATDFSAQKNRLLHLNLRSNQFNEIPTSAIGILSNLTEFHMDLNSVNTVRRSAFAGVSNLRVLELARNPLDSMDSEAFSGLENTLNNLSLQQCHLGSEHLKAIIPLRSLTYLDISDNSVDQIHEILANMKYLQVLKASRNRITSLKKSFYSSMSNSLRVLYLDDNPLVDVESDTFVDLSQLQELYLDGAKKLSLDANSFASQRTSLQLLSLRMVNQSDNIWPAVGVLSGIRTLWMSSCGLTEIPDFIFSKMYRLENLDLNYNGILRLTQSSLYGLSNSLVRLYLSENQLRTIGECVFYKFSKLDVLQLQLNSNPLQCDCGLKWLHDRLKPYKADPATNFRVMALRWSCANLGNKSFVSLSDEDFLSCNASNPEADCEKFETVTPFVPPFSDLPTPTPTATGSVMIHLTEVTHDSILVTWTTAHSNEFSITYIDNGNEYSVAKLPVDAIQYRLKGLTPQTLYIVCVAALAVGETEIACANATTSSESTEVNMFPAILGATLAAGVLVTLGVAACLIYFCVQRFRHSKPHPLVRSPTVGRQSKRYRKTNDHETALTEVGGEMPEETLIHTLVTMTDEQRDRVVNLLTNSMNNLDDVDRKASFRYVGAHYGRMGPVPTRLISKDRHEYEEIPDTYYDEIPANDEATNIYLVEQAVDQTDKDRSKPRDAKD